LGHPDGSVLACFRAATAVDAFVLVDAGFAIFQFDGFHRARRLAVFAAHAEAPVNKGIAAQGGEKGQSAEERGHRQNSSFNFHFNLPG